MRFLKIGQLKLVTSQINLLGENQFIDLDMKKEFKNLNHIIGLKILTGKHYLQRK